MQLVTLQLTPDEVASFKVFREHQDDILQIVRILEVVKNGSATLNFNPQGILMNIEVKQQVYKREKFDKIL